MLSHRKNIISRRDSGVLLLMLDKPENIEQRSSAHAERRGRMLDGSLVSVSRQSIAALADLLVHVAFDYGHYRREVPSADME